MVGSGSSRVVISNIRSKGLGHFEALEIIPKRLEDFRGSTVVLHNGCPTLVCCGTSSGAGSRSGVIFGQYRGAHLSLSGQLATGSVGSTLWWERSYLPILYLSNGSRSEEIFIK